MQEGSEVVMELDGRHESWMKVHPGWVREALARRSCLDMLMERFGIDAALVSVPKLAKAIGMSRSTIYASLKAGQFFIPHRMVGQSPMFTIDDMVSWYLGDQVKKKVLAKAEAELAGQPVAFSDRASRDRSVDALVATAMATVDQRLAQSGRVGSNVR